MNREDLVSWLRCNQNILDTKVYEFCGIMGCQGMKCSACRDEAVKEAADFIETFLTKANVEDSDE